MLSRIRVNLQVSLHRVSTPPHLCLFSCWRCTWKRTSGQKIKRGMMSWAWFFFVVVIFVIFFLPIFLLSVIIGFNKNFDLSRVQQSHKCSFA
jgi:hypothetical protein